MATQPNPAAMPAAANAAAASPAAAVIKPAATPPAVAKLATQPIAKPVAAKPQRPVPPAVPPPAPIDPNQPTVVLGPDHRLPEATHFVEVRLSGLTRPLAKERCLLFLPDGRILKGRTSTLGVIRFEGLVRPRARAEAPTPIGSVSRPSSLGPDPLVIADPLAVPVVILPDILEEFKSTPPAGDLSVPLSDYYSNKRRPQAPPRPSQPDFNLFGRYNKNIELASVRFRQGDQRFYLAMFDVATEIRIDALTPREKFEHFVWVYTSNEASYTRGTRAEFFDPLDPPPEVRGDSARPVYSGGQRGNVWKLPSGRHGTSATRYIGLACNAHLNFFLGYWLNYNHFYTPNGSSTETAHLLLLDSGNGSFQYGKQSANHRGYREFLEPITGFSAFSKEEGEFPGRPPLDPKTRKPQPTQPGRYLKYIRMSQFFELATGNLTAEGRQLVDALDEYNVYSLSSYYWNEKGKTARIQANALARTRAWLKMHRKEPHLQSYKVSRTENKRKTSVALANATDAEIDGLSDDTLWEIVWNLKDAQAADAALVATLRKNELNTDHHAGILVKRAKGGGPLTGAKDEAVELWKFSADGPDGVLTKLTDLATSVRASKRELTHLAIFKIKPLRPGGFAPTQDITPAGPLDLEAAPRFIQW